MRAYRADVDILDVVFLDGPVTIVPVDRDRMREILRELHADPYVLEVVRVPVCRCYRCGKLLRAEKVSPDRYPILGIDGGTYRQDNIRPSCLKCNVETGSVIGQQRKALLKVKRMRRKVRSAA